MTNEKKKQLFPAAEAKALEGLVVYQDGAVVSREILKGAKGTVTVFAFGEGQGLSEHTAPFDALVYIIDGEAEVTIDGEPLTVKRGELVLMPAHKPHALHAAKQFKMLLTLIRE